MRAKSAMALPLLLAWSSVAIAQHEVWASACIAPVLSRVLSRDSIELRNRIKIAIERARLVSVADAKILETYLDHDYAKLTPAQINKLNAIHSRNLALGRELNHTEIAQVSRELQAIIPDRKKRALFLKWRIEGREQSPLLSSARHDLIRRMDVLDWDELVFITGKREGVVEPVAVAAKDAVAAMSPSQRLAFARYAIMNRSHPSVPFFILSRIIRNASDFEPEHSDELYSLMKVIADRPNDLVMARVISMFIHRFQRLFTKEHAISSDRHAMAYRFEHAR